MKYKSIQDLYLIKGKLVFRKHMFINGREVNIWKTIGHPDEFTEEELRKIVDGIREELKELYGKRASGQKNAENHSVKRIKLKKVKREPEIPRDTGSSQGMENISRVSSESYHGVASHSYSHSSVFSSFPTLGEILDRFFSWCRVTWKFSTYVREVDRSKNLLRFFGRDFPFLQIGPAEVEAFKVKRLNEGVTASTVNKDLRLLSTIINRAVEFEWIPHHRLYRKPLLVKGVKSERIRYLTEDEEKRLMQALSQSRSEVLKDIVVFALHTGMRLGEILNLKWENINLRERVVILFPEQTKNRRRHVLPLNDAAFEVLKRRFELKADSCPYVFHRNGKRVKSIKEAFKSALRRAGIEDFRFHDLRHTFASRLVQKSVDLYVVKELLNHSDVKTTQRYAHLRLDDLKRAVKLLETKE